MTLATARSAAGGSGLPTSGSGVLASLLDDGAQAVTDDDEAALDVALDNRAFHNLCDFFLSRRGGIVFKEEFYVRRLHRLLTDFVVLMPLKVKEIRNRADDAARNGLMHEQEGIVYNMPLAGQHFEMLMRSVAALYAEDELGLGLVADYWCPTDGAGAAGVLPERFPQRQVALFKFVRLAGDLLMPSLYTPYVAMLVSLANHPQTALHCFNLLKMNGMAAVAASGQQQPNTSTVSWEHFFLSMQQYFANLRQEVAHPGDPTTAAIYRYSIRDFC